jgi:hypothetical protein
MKRASFDFSLVNKHLKKVGKIILYLFVQPCSLEPLLDVVLQVVILLQFSFLVHGFIFLSF